MRYVDILTETYTALSANMVRSGLTTLGIVIGIASVIAMVSIGQGVGGQIESSIQGLGSNLLTIMPGSVEPGRAMVSSGRGSGQSLKNEDVDVLRSIPGVSAVSAEQSRRFQVLSSVGNNTNTTIIGVTPEYEDVRNISISSGSFILDRHIASLSRVAVVGSAVAEDLFGVDEDPIGKTLRMNKSDYKIIGVLESKGGTGFFNPDDTIYVPLNTMQKILAGSDYLSTIAVSVREKSLMEQVKIEATEKLAIKHKVDIASPDFSIISQSDILSALTQVTDTFTLFLSAVAGISLLVGGIGIMNMMLTTVTERTREIGLRKAIGAKAKDITMQFLMESIVLTLLGGVLGIVLGWGISMIISAAASIATTVSMEAVLLAFGVSAVIGVVFGYYPARRASRLNPMDALRYE